jgi:hypothetical protein
MRLKQQSVFLSILILFFIAGCSSKQKTTEILNTPGSTLMFETEDITWFGLDFSQASIVGVFEKQDFITPSNLDEWNNLFLTEPNRYRLDRAFQKKKAYIDITSVNRRNKNVSIPDLVIQYTGAKVPNKFDETKIQDIVKDLETTHPTKLGAVFIVDRMDQQTELISMYVTFFNTKTKDVIYVTKTNSKGSGFGFRNFWAGGMRRALGHLETDYMTWNK